MKQSSPTSQAHVDYIVGGGCPVFDERNKIWCNDTVARHSPGAHWATHIHSDGTTTRVQIQNRARAILPGPS